MRIVAGKLRGRIFDSPRTARTHPMSEKLRGAIFYILGDVEGLTVLDAFAGSGALAFESLSRGASHATMIEIDKQAFQTCQQNIEALGLQNRTRLIQGNIKTWASNQQDTFFDMVMCDPPYDAVLEGLIFRIAKLVTSGGTLVLSWPVSEPIPKIEDMNVLQHKRYGNATLVFYRRMK
jgi:16S rRNA (guanine966-N2)-methyltransferase